MLSKQKLKYIQSLGQKKFRQQEDQFLAEGPKLVNEMLQDAATSVTAVFAVKEWIAANPEAAVKTEVTEITEAELEKISQLSTPNQVLALVKKYPELIPAARGRITLVLDAVQDPGNLGTLVRIADWFGIPQMVCSHDTAELYNPKVVQATMGSIARVQVCYTELAGWISRQQDVPVYAAVLGGKDLRTVPTLSEGIVVIGNESTGIRAGVLELATARVTIPHKGKAESLNAAVAAGIILSHLVT